MKKTKTLLAPMQIIIYERIGKETFVFIDKNALWIKFERWISRQLHRPINWFKKVFLVDITPMRELENIYITIKNNKLVVIPESEVDAEHKTIGININLIGNKDNYFNK